MDENAKPCITGYAINAALLWLFVCGFAGAASVLLMQGTSEKALFFFAMCGLAACMAFETTAQLIALWSRERVARRGAAETGGDCETASSPVSGRQEIEGF